MNNRIIENVIYEYRYAAVDQEIRSRIPNISHLDSLRRSCKDDNPQVSPFKQVLFRAGMMLCIGVIFYLVSVVV